MSFGCDTRGVPRSAATGRGAGGSASTRVADVRIGSAESRGRLGTIILGIAGNLEIAGLGDAAGGTIRSSASGNGTATNGPRAEEAVAEAIGLGKPAEGKDLFGIAGEDRLEFAEGAAVRASIVHLSLVARGCRTVLAGAGSVATRMTSGTVFVVKALASELGASTVSSFASVDWIQPSPGEPGWSQRLRSTNRTPNSLSSEDCVDRSASAPGIGYHAPQQAIAAATSSNKRLFLRRRPARQRLALVTGPILETRDVRVKIVIFVLPGERRLMPETVGCPFGLPCEGGAG